MKYYCTSADQVLKMRLFLRWIYLLILLLNSILLTLAEYGSFTSVCQMNLLRDEERRLIKGLHRYIGATEKLGELVPEDVVSLLEKAEVEQQVLEDEFAENPLSSFHTLYRIYHDWKEVFRHVWCDDCDKTPASQDFNITFGIAERKLGGWITQEDLQVAAKNIVKLYEMYDLDVRDVFDGYIQDHVVTPLPAEELYFIAATADKQDRMRSAVVWFEELYRRISENMYPDSTLKLITVARVLAGVYNKIGMPQKSIELFDQINNEGLDMRQLKRDVEYYTLRLNGLPLDERTKDLDLYKKTKPSKFTQLCRQSLKSTKAESKLKCFLRASDRPFYFIKEELFNKNPRISVFHDVITEDDLRQLSNCTSARRLVYTREVSEETAINNKKFGFYDVEQSVVKKLRNRMRKILQIPQQEEIDIKRGNQRVATWNYVIEGAKSGGYKVFMSSKTSVPLVSGSVIVWYNQNSDGRQDGRLSPWDCHTIIGSQTVVEDYLEEDGTVSTMKCFNFFKNSP